MKIFTALTNCRKYFFAIPVFLFSILSALKSWEQVSITSTTIPVTQNFDGLPSTNGASGWTDNSTLTGWYSTQSTLIADAGSSITGGLHDYGINSSTDRSLGALSSGTSPKFALRLVNNTGVTITSLAISFKGEQWRQTVNSQTLTFDYQVGATDISSGVWTANTAFDFTAIKTGTANNLDGNASGNYTSISNTLTVAIASGQEIWLRWNKSGTTSPGLGIDDLSITASVAPANSYTWNVVSGNYQTPTSWTPTRTIPADNDILKFSNGTSISVTSIPTQTIGQLLISNNTTVNFKDAADGTVSRLTITGDGISSTADFAIPSGSSLTFDVPNNNVGATTGTTANGLAILLASCSGVIDGTLVFDNSSGGRSPNHRLYVSGTGSISVNGYITAKRLHGSVFGSSMTDMIGLDNSVTFNSGSVYESKDGATPFGDDGDTYAIFKTGSKYKLSQYGPPSLANRNYADFEIAYNNQSFIGNTGTTAVDNLTIDAGSTLGLNLATTTNPYNLTIKGNLVVNGTLNYDPPSSAASTFTFGGSSAQQISIGSSGNIIFGNNLTVRLNNTSGLLLNSNITIGGVLKLTKGNLYINGNTLTLNGTFNNTNGYLSGSPTSNLISSSGGNLGSLFFDQTTDNTTNVLKNFTINSGSVTLGNLLNITAGTSANTFGTVAATGNLAAAGFLKLKSNQYGDAIVGPSTGNVTGNVTVERYFPSIRAWRFVAVPFSSTGQTINQAWQEGYTDVTLSCPPQYTGTPGYGTAITYNNTNGYDVHNNNYKTSIQVYKGGNWITPSSTNNAATDNLVTASANGSYALFVRGDRSVCLTYEAPAVVTTLRPAGVLNQINSGNDINFSLSSTAGGYVMIGNPYACPVNIRRAIQALGTNITYDQFLVWDPRLGGSTGTGGYISFSNGTQVPMSAAPGDTTVGYTASAIIQSGQAFMVKLSGSNTTGSLSLKENDKSVKEVLSNVFGLTAANTVQLPSTVYINLLDDADALMDGIGTAFSNNYSAAIDEVDAQKHWNEEIENMAIIRHDTALAIEFRPLPKTTDTVFLRLYLKQHPYKLQLFSENLAPGFSCIAWLIDKYLGTQTEINLQDTSTYSFTPNTDTNSYRNRFMVVFSQANNSRIAKLDSLISKVRTHIYPNPVNGKMFKLLIENLKNDTYTVNIYTIQGKLAATRSVSGIEGINSWNIPLPASIISGSYTIQILSSSGTVVSSVPLLVSR